MPRKTQISRRRHKNRKTKNRRTIRRYRRGGNGEKVRCCMCEKMVDKNKTFIPMNCLKNNWKAAAHRICEECWWDPNTGFALENASHKCPGCVKGLPLTEYNKEQIIDLTED
jgi:hypothetical protein